MSIIKNIYQLIVPACYNILQDQISSTVNLEPKNLIPSQLEQTLNLLLKELESLNTTIKFSALGRDHIFEFLHQDRLFRMYLPFADIDFIQRFILKRSNFYENHELIKIQDLISPESIVVDAGANIGNHSIFFAGVCQAKLVYAFEPLRETYRLLKRNLELNCLTNVQPINAALGAEVTYANLVEYNRANIGGSSIEYVSKGDYKVTTIDALNLQKLDFLKIDVEGRHVSVLQGAQKTIELCHPFIWIELRGKEIEAGNAALNDMGYQQLYKLSANNYLYEPKNRSV